MEIRFISPREGETVDLHTPELKAWLEARNSGIEDVRVGEPFDYLAPEVSGAEPCPEDSAALGRGRRAGKGGTGSCAVP